MDAFYNFTIYSATVRFSSVKSCFLTVPEKWVKDIPGEILAFKILYGESQDKVAYMSCDKDFSRWNDIDSKVFMNEKFAKKLGLMEKDSVFLQPLRTSIPKAIKVTIEPLTSDDWEILELNSSYVENKLMNQIRIIWIDLIFPIWIENNCIYTKVVACEPETSQNPVILHMDTEVSVVPKDRDLISSHWMTNSQKQKESLYLQFQFLRDHSKSEQSVDAVDSDDGENSVLDPDTIVPSFAANFLASWFSSPKEETSSFKEPGSFSEVYDFNFESVLRVIPYTNPQINLPSVIQATTVFISASTYFECCDENEVPPCFVGLLEKYSLPDRRQRKGLNDNLKNNLSDNSSLTKDGDKSKLDSDVGQKPFDSCYVTVMVVKSAEEDEFKLPASLFTYKNVIVVPKELKRALSIEVTSLVHLKSVLVKPLLSYKLIFHPITTLGPNITEKVIHEHFRQWAFSKNRKHQTFIISNGTLVKLKIHGKKCEFFIHLQERETSKNNNDSSLSSIDSDKSTNLESDCEYGLLSYKSLKRTPVKIGSAMCSTIYDDRLFLLKEAGMYCDVKASKLSELGGIKKLCAKAMEDIEFWLKLRPLSYISSHSSTYYGCILICGPKGVGKSSFANALCKKFANYPYHVLVRNVQCLSLKGKRVDTIAKKWYDIVSEAIRGQPSIILFEDLDYIASAPLSYEQENGPDGVYFSSVSQAFINMMNRITSSESKVVVIATSQSLHSLHPSLVNTKGRHIFQSVVEVKPPNTDQRAEILVALVCNKPHIHQSSVDKVNIIDIAIKTEGYVALDLSTLVDRATHAAWMRLASFQEEDRITLINEDFEIALKGLVPSSLRGVSLQMQDQRTWNDVGGLSNVKKVIQQIIMWPTKYKEIYKNYFLKPQTNILLYGAPGTGKTLLAGVVANECGFNFISIKGPELLSKYIGASEQSVRDLFQRATAAKPCILFFDEFDSIAPRRGHDSTGVTDRVVNQLLTQLDGVESLEGVHVLAATSRPELIDPALMRPGRLDKCLHCPLPDMNERVEILQCLSSKLPLYDDVDFESIAPLTEYFSGADLQALLYTAHIEALREIQYSSTKHCTASSEDPDYKRASDKLLYMPSLESGLQNPSYEDGKKIVHDASIIQDNYFGVRGKQSRRNSTLVVSISQKHLLNVASEMKPSVSFEERMRYETVFKDFLNILSGEPSASPGNVKRVTLA